MVSESTIQHPLRHIEKFLSNMADDTYINVVKRAGYSTSTDGHPQRPSIIVYKAKS